MRKRNSDQALTPAESSSTCINKEAREEAKGKRENKQIVSCPAIRNAKFTRKTLIAKN